MCLQELKCLEEAFPRMEMEAAGYNVAVHGQKSYNGVAILAKAPIETTIGLPGDESDTQSRYIEAVIPCGAARGAGRLPLSAQRQPARHG